MIITKVYLEQDNSIQQHNFKVYTFYESITCLHNL